MKRLFLLALFAVGLCAETVVNTVRPTFPNLDTFPVTTTQYQLGGWMNWMTNTSQLTNTDVATGGLPSARRKAGMISVINGLQYQLGSDLTTWTVATGAGLTPQMFGALADGVTDDTASISNAITAAMTTGAPLNFPPGQYLSSGIQKTLTASLTITADAGAVVIGATTGTLWNFSVDAVWEDTVTSVVTNLVNLQTDGAGTALTRTIQVATTSNHDVKEGDILKLLAMERIPGGLEFGTNNAPRIAEHFVYVLPDITTNLFSMNQMSVYSYATSPRLLKMNKAVKVVIDGLTFEEDPANKDDPSFTRNGFLAISGAVGPEMRNLTANNAYGRSFWLRSCYQPIADNLVGATHANIAVSGFARFGYLLADSSCSLGMYTRLYGRNLRHVFTTIGQGIDDSAPNTSWRSFGGAMYFTVSDSVGQANMNASYDAHEDAYGFTISDCTSVGNFDGNNALGPSFQLRGSHGRLLNCSSYNDHIPVMVYSSYTNSATYMEIRGFRAVGATAGSVHLIANGLGSPAQVGPVLVEDSTFEMKGIDYPSHYALKLTGITNVVFRNCSFDVQGANSFIRSTPKNPEDGFAGPLTFDKCRIVFSVVTNNLQFEFVGMTNVTFRDTSVKIIGNNSTTGAIQVEDNSSGYGTHITLNNVQFDLSECTGQRNLFYLDGTNSAVSGSDISIYTAETPTALGYTFKSGGSLQQFITITNLMIDVNRAPVDPAFDQSNVRVDYYLAPGGTSKYLQPAGGLGDITLRWPVEFVRYSATLSSNTTITLPKAIHYQGGKTIEIYRESPQNFGLLVVPSAGDTIGGLTSIEIQVPGDLMLLTSDGVSRWVLSNPRPRSVRYMTGGSVASSDYYVSVDATVAARQITLADVTGFRIPQILFIRKSDSTDNVVDIWPFDSTQTINGGTNLVLTKVNPGVLLIRELTSTATNWVIGARAPINNTLANEQIILGQAMGSSFFAWTGGKGVTDIANTYTFLDSRARYMAIWVPARTLCTGVGYLLSVQGNFTEDNFNGLGLYSQSGGTMNQIAVTANDANIWKGTAGTVIKTPWTSPLYLNQGVYFVAPVYNYSAEVTAPVIRANANTPAGVVTTIDYTGSMKISGNVDGVTALPASQVSSGTTADNTQPAFGLY